MTPERPLDLMQFHYHLGAHCTDEDRILRCLLKNKSKIARNGTIVPGPGKYRPVIRQALVTLKGQSAPPDMQQAMLDQFLDANIKDVFCVRWLYLRAAICGWIAAHVSDDH
jgi:hypothetical protein